MRISAAPGCVFSNRQSRYAILSKAALDILTQYWRSCGRPMGYFFPKQSGKDEPIDSFFLSRHIHAHERRLGWPERITCHSFRHAFGTHLYENGTDLLTIKALMGHKSVSSTAIYVHLAGGGAVKGAVSPFDRLGGMHGLRSSRFLTAHGSSMPLPSVPPLYRGRLLPPSWPANPES